MLRTRAPWPLCPLKPIASCPARGKVSRSSGLSRALPSGHTLGGSRSPRSFTAAQNTSRSLTILLSLTTSCLLMSVLLLPSKGWAALHNLSPWVSAEFPKPPAASLACDRLSLELVPRLSGCHADSIYTFVQCSVCLRICSQRGEIAAFSTPISKFCSTVERGRSLVRAQELKPSSLFPAPLHIPEISPGKPVRNHFSKGRTTPKEYAHHKAKFRSMITI